MVRTQLYLDARLHRRLGEIAGQQGRTVSDLVREAVRRTYGLDRDDRADTLEGVAGLWRDRDDLGGTDAYVRRLRRDTGRRHLPRR